MRKTMPGKTMPGKTVLAMIALGATAVGWLGVAPAGAVGPMARAASVDSALRPPPGFVEEVSPLLAAPSGRQSHGSVLCPGRKVPVGGGAVFNLADLGVNLNSSEPAGQGWDADVNNASATDAVFQVVALCEARPDGYRVRRATFDNPTGSQPVGPVSCPRGTVPLGGGAFSDSASTSVNMNSDFPETDGWAVDMNNADANDTTFTVFAVCAKKPRGYLQVASPLVDNPSDFESEALVTCPPGEVALSGGGFSSSTSTAVNLSSSIPSPGVQGWEAFENNASGVGFTVDAHVVCAGGPRHPA